MKDVIPENPISKKAKNKLKKIKQIEKTVDREHLYDTTKKYTFDFQYFRTISTFGRDIFNGKLRKKKLMKIKEIY